MSGKLYCGRAIFETDTMTASEPNLSNPDLRRGDFAAEVLELEGVLALYAREAASSLGRRMLRDLQPRSKPSARRALGRVQEALFLADADLEPPMAGFTDLGPAFELGLRGFDEETLARLRNLIEARARVASWLAERRDKSTGKHPHELPLWLELLGSIPTLANLHKRLDEALDERGQLRSDASPLLGRLRREATQHEKLISKRLREVMGRSSVRAVLSDTSVHRRGGRPVLAVRARSSGRVRGILHDRSASGESAFIEPNEIIEAGNHLSEVRADARREVERILLELAQIVLDQAPAIEALSQGLGEMELAVIGARFASRHGAKVPLLPGDPAASPGLSLRQARHPLLIEQQAQGEIEEVQAIDLRLGADFDMLIVTGPNTGGKTLALKTAGLFALLTRLGLPVTADEGSTVPLYDRVLADIGDEQEIRQNLSTFASHLARIDHALAQADEHSLVLLDELGGGTDPEEGAALGIAVLEELLARRCPTLCSTHIGRLKEFAYRHGRAENACTEFDLETLAPRYRVHLGTPGESCALVIARRLNLPEDVLRRAEGLIRRADGDLDELFRDVRESRVEAERVRKSTEEQRDQVRDQVQALREEREKIERRGEQLESEAQKGLEERVRDALRGVQRARTLLPQLGREQAEAMGEVLDTLAADLSGASLTQRRVAFIDSLHKGSLVYLPRYRKRVQVHKVNHERQMVVCKMGGMKIEVPFDEVTPYEAL